MIDRETIIAFAIVGSILLFLQELVLRMFLGAGLIGLAGDWYEEILIIASAVAAVAAVWSERRSQRDLTELTVKIATLEQSFAGLALEARIENLSVVHELSVRLAKIEASSGAGEDDDG